MDVLVIVCFGFLIGCTIAEPSRTVVATPISTANQMASFSKDLECESGTNVYVAAVVYSYDFVRCGCVTERQKCSTQVIEPRDLNSISSSCWTSSACNLTFSTPPDTCILVNATITYVCAPDNPALTINLESTHTGSSLTAGYSATSDPGALWVCSVEAWNCSSVDVALNLFIRNGNDTASYFSVPGGRLGQLGVATRPWTFPTPFNVDLNVLPGSALLNAYFTVQAERNLTVTCGRRNSVPPTAFCNVPIVSTPPSRKFGQALTAVHSSSGVETDNSTWVCVVESADCSTGAPVDVSALTSSRGNTSASFFSLDGQELSDNYTGNINTPFFLTWHLVNRSTVDTAFVHVRATENTTISCGWQGNTPPILFCTQPFLPLSRKFGRALTAVHSSSGVETDSSAVGCVVETADCSEGTPVDVSVLIRQQENGSTSFFSLAEQRLNASYRGRLSTPFSVVLYLVNGSEVDNAYVSIKAMVNVSMSCGQWTSDSGEQTASSLCRPKSDSVVGPAVGGTVAGLVVIVVLVIYFRRVRKSGRTETRAPGRSRVSDDNRHNGSYDDVIAAEDRPKLEMASAADTEASDGAGSSDYDVLGQKKPPPDAASSSNIYSHIANPSP